MGMILDCLRCWVTEYHIDGFRFDLASILARREDGAPLSDPPLLKMIAHDPILGRSKLIAEPWDAGGLYHVGAFPAYGRWGEWNGKYRDAIRKFIRSDAGQVPEMIQRIMGSPDLYPNRGPIASVNFITAHDGFTLNDLVSYNDKHNEANLEGNRDGANDNNSWNCGVEGETDDPTILALRRQQMKNAIAILLVSQGVPMIVMGDEVARTQSGNNNTYCQDNELSWLDWRSMRENAEIFRFFKHMITFRHWHPVLRHGYHLRGQDYQNAGIPDISWFSLDLAPNAPEDDRLTLAFMLSGAHAKGGLAEDNDVFVAMNMHWESQHFALPQLPGKAWYVFANTGAESPQDIFAPGQEVILSDQVNLMLSPRSVIILISREALQAFISDEVEESERGFDPELEAQVLEPTNSDPQTELTD
jgi:glycogen operon protein